jgi:hypothetical protein
MQDDCPPEGNGEGGIISEVETEQWFGTDPTSFTATLAVLL